MGFYMVFFHAPHFSVPQSVVRSSLPVFSLHISNIYAKKRGTGPHTVVETRVQPEQLGRRLWISQPPRLSAFLESE